MTDRDLKLDLFATRYLAALERGDYPLARELLDAAEAARAAGDPAPARVLAEVRAGLSGEAGLS